MRQRKQIYTDFRNMDRYKTISRNAPHSERPDKMATCTPMMVSPTNKGKVETVNNMRKFEVGKRYYKSGLTFEIVKETERSITVRLCSDFSSIPSHWTTKKDGTPGGVIKTFRKSTKLYGIA